MNEEILEELRLIKTKIYEMQQEIYSLKNNKPETKSYLVEYAGVQFDLSDVARIQRCDIDLDCWRKRALIVVNINDGNSFNLDFGVRDRSVNRNMRTKEIADKAYKELQQQIKDFKNGVLLEESE